MKISNFQSKFSESSYADMVNQLNVFMVSIGLENMKGQIVENISIPAGVSVEVSHNLKVAPKYRIILRQIDGGTIIDGDTVWSDTKISLKNSGGSDAIVSIFLIRG